MIAPQYLLLSHDHTLTIVVKTIAYELTKATTSYSYVLSETCVIFANLDGSKDETNTYQTLHILLFEANLVRQILILILK